MDKKQTFRRPVRKSTVIFYSIYLFVIVAFFVGMHFALQPLEAWLARYEASQPEQKCQEIFQDSFQPLRNICGIQLIATQECSRIHSNHGPAGDEIGYCHL